jgi:predicted amidohydrolase YtcJ
LFKKDDDMKESLEKFDRASADLILEKGVLVTMDPSIPPATALAIKGSRIVWVGDQNDVGVIDLQGGCVYPGFMDTHMHVLHMGIVQSYLQLQNCSDKASILAKVEERVRISQKGEWIFGVGWDDYLLPIPVFANMS